MIKHIGRYNNRKIIVLFRQVPGEEHMCLVAFPDALPSQLHDDIMKVLESAMGQGAKELSDALHRSMGADGRNLLGVLHKEGYIKKVQTAQVLVTPNTKSTVRLDELNKILNEMAKGEEAVQKLKELDQSAGFGSGVKNRRGQQPVQEIKTTSSDILGESAPVIGSDGIISDQALALSLKQQAEKMAAEAKALLAESERLHKEAAQLVPPVLESNVKPKATKAKKTSKVKAD